MEKNQKIRLIIKTPVGTFYTELIFVTEEQLKEYEEHPTRVLTYLKNRTFTFKVDNVNFYIPLQVLENSVIQLIKIQ
jgi:hypothetical protein